MGLHVVAGYAKNNGPCFGEIFEFISELHGFCGASRRVVFGVKVQNYWLTGVRMIGNFDAIGGICFELWEGFVYNDSHVLYVQK